MASPETLAILVGGGPAARRYRIRLRRGDFEDPGALAKIAAPAGLSSEKFRSRFASAVEHESPPLVLTPSP